MSTAPDVYFTFPRFFTPYPRPLPSALPPPVKERSFRSPFGINKTLYNFALRPEIPFLFAAAYIIAVFTLNEYNKKRDWKPWWISKQKFFKYFVVVHNVLLALYSFATFLAMFRAIALTLPGWREAAGAGTWRAETADALCKLHGPRGIGDAATFNTSINIWEVKNSIIKLGHDGNPDPTDKGRLWNEGLAFWGWLFYVSKFYEVLDTLVILAKGKRSATLQTYHHAGAMLCMWAGIRFMSPPIWMFVFINSAIHAMMYTYFTLSALGFRVPQGLKRTLTSLQIAQFIIGASYAALHLFIQYDMPMQVPYSVTSLIERAVSSASASASAASKSATSVASAVSTFAESPTAAPTLAAMIKKFLLRAAGEEGVAERVGMGMRSQDELLQDPLGAARAEIKGVPDEVEKFVERRFETRYRTEWTRVNCIDTSGEAFAIYLNLLYLAPLTFLFARFFIRAYTARGRKSRPSLHAAAGAAKDATSQTEHEVERAGEKAEERGSEEAAKRLEDLKQDVKAMKEGAWFGSGKKGGGEKKSSSDPVKKEESGEDGAEPGSKEQGEGDGEEQGDGNGEEQGEGNGGEQGEGNGEEQPDAAAVREGEGETKKEDGEEDTDAMGKSGSIVDYTSDRAQEGASVNGT